MTKKQTFINPIGRLLGQCLTKEEIVKYETLAKKLNVFQAALIGLSTGTKPNFESIKGINQEAFLSTSLINDILTLNNATERILKYLKENEEYYARTDLLEIHLSFLSEQLECINKELKECESDITKNRTERAALLAKKSGLLDERNAVESDQNDSNNKLNQIYRLMELNGVILAGLFATVERIKNLYSNEFLNSIFKDENPFNVEVDHEGLSRVLDPK